MPSPFGRDLARRVAVTLAVVAVYFAGRRIPLPGLAPEALTDLLSLGNRPPTQFSVFALGVVPIVSALILVEMTKLAVPRLARWQAQNRGNAAKLRTVAIGLALLLATVQGLGLAAAYEDIHQLVIEPGLLFRLGCVVTLVAATALMLVLIAIIDRQGIGSGLWVLFLAAPLAALPLQMAQLSDAYIAGQYAGLGILLGGAFAVLTVAAITALLLAWGYATGTAETLIWSPLIAYTALPWVLIAIALAFSGGNADAAQVMLTSVPWLLPLVITVLLLLSAFLYVREQRRAGVDTPVDVPVLGLTLAAVGISGELIGRQYYGALPLSETQWIVATVVATTLLFEAGVLGRKSPAGEAQSSPRNR